MIRIKEFNVYASGKTIVEEFNVHWKAGSINAIVGPNGCGKTTLFKGICGLNKCEGLIYIDEKPVNITEDTAKYIAAFLEGGGYYTNMSVYQNLKYVCLLNNINYKKIEDVINLVKFPKSHINAKAGKLSLGQRQKLGLAMILILDRPILLLDEPLNGLDIDAVDDFNELLLTLSNEHQKTIAITSHLIAKLAPIANTISIMKAGKTVYQGNLTKFDQMFLLTGKDEKHKHILNQHNIIYTEAPKGFLTHHITFNDLSSLIAANEINAAIKPIENIENLYKLFNEHI